MIGWVIGILMIVAGFITSLFIARDELKFNIIQMGVAVLLFTFAVAIIAFWPRLKTWFKCAMNKRKDE